MLTRDFLRMFEFPDHGSPELVSSNGGEMSQSYHSASHFNKDNPISNEHVIFLPGGKVMVVDWGIQSFAKTVVSVAIAGVVAVGAAVAAIIWADNRIEKKRSVQVRRSGPGDLNEEEEDSGSEEE